jgi:hypothetical protein
MAVTTAPQQRPLADALDLHLHTAPDVIERRYSDIEAARRAQAAGMAAIVLKCHHESTVGRAAAASEATGFPVYGGIVLNDRLSGGVHVETVAAALALGARIVWWPTVTSRAHKTYLGQAAGPDPPRRRAAHAIARAVADSDAVVATGHVDKGAIAVLVDSCRAAGARLLITHADFAIPSLTLDEQAAIASSNDHVWFERCAYTWLRSPQPDQMLDRMARAIAATGGPSRNVLTSDLGQPELPPYPDGFRSFADAVATTLVGAQATRQMLRETPRELLGLEPHR